MHARLFAMFAVGATVGYAAHREPAAPIAAVHAAPAAPAAEAPAPSPPPPPPPRVIVVRAAPVPAIDPSTPTDPEPEREAAPDPAPADPPPPPHGALRGTVTDSRGQPVYNVLVAVTSPITAPAHTYTNSDGGYQLDDLPGAVYSVRYSRYGAQTLDRSVGVSVLEPTEIDVTLPDE